MRPSRRRRAIGYLSFAIIFVVLLFLVGWMLWSYSILSQTPALLVANPNLSVLWTNETLLGAIIGSIAAIVGGVVGGVVQVRLANSYQAIEKREQAIRTVFNWKSDDQHGSMRGIDLRRADLRGVKLEAAIGTEIANLSYSRMEAVDLSHALLIGVDLSEANLQRATLTGTMMERCKLDRANLKETIWDNAQLSDVSLMEADFFKARLRKTMLNNSVMDAALLSQTTVESGSELRNAYLREARLDNSVFRDSDLTGALMLRTTARHARFEQVTMNNANLIGSNLSGSVFHKVNLSQADLSPAVIVIDPDSLEIFRCSISLGKLSRSDSHAVDVHSSVIASLNDVLKAKGITDYQLHEIRLDPADASSIITEIKDSLSQQSGAHKEESDRLSEFWQKVVNGGVAQDERLIIALQRTNLSRARLTDINLRGACLRGVDMRRVKLHNVDLRDSDLTDADLTNADLGEIQYNPKTKWPTGFDMRTVTKDL